MPKASKLPQDLCHETCTITSIINRTIDLYVSAYWTDQHLQYHKRVKVINRTINLWVGTYRVDQHLHYHKRAKVINRTIDLCVSTYRVDQRILGIHAGIQRCCQRLVGGGVHVKSTGGCTLQQVVKLLLSWWWVIPQLKDIHICSSLAKHKTWMSFERYSHVFIIG